MLIYLICVLHTFIKIDHFLLIITKKSDKLNDFFDRMYSFAH